MGRFEAVILMVSELHELSRGFHRYNTLKELGYTVHGLPLVPVDRPLYGKPDIIRRLAWRVGLPIPEGDINKNLLRLVSMHDFDIVWIEKGNTIFPQTLKKIKKIRPFVKLVSYSEDDMMAKHNRSHFYTAGVPLYDVVFTTKSYNCADNELPSLGAKRVFFIDKAYDRYSHFPVELSVEDRELYGSDVAFTGTFEVERAEAIAALAQSGIRVSVWGSGWENFSAPNLMSVKGQGVYGEEYRKVICAAKINLCFLRKANRDLQTDRSVEIPACGGFMLAERTSEHMRLFNENTEAAFFDDVSELIAKTHYFLDNDEKRISIASRGRERCLTGKYSHHDRMQSMLALLS